MELFKSIFYTLHLSSFKILPMWWAFWMKKCIKFQTPIIFI